MYGVIDQAKLVVGAYKRAALQGFGWLYKRRRVLAATVLADLTGYSRRHIFRVLDRLVRIGVLIKLSKKRGYMLAQQMSLSEFLAT